MYISKELLLSCAADAGLTFSDEQIDRFDLFARTLTEYNKKVNLTAVTDPDGIVVRHFADSFLLCKYVSLVPGMRVCDVGTGAGFPGICLLIVCPDISLSLIESIGKKTEFLRFALSELGLAAEVLRQRAEEAGRVPALRQSFDLATARAVASLNTLSEYCIPLVRKGGRFMPLKARLSAEEREDGIRAAALLGAELVQTHAYTLCDGSGREIPEFIKKKDTGSLYPRHASRIASKPL